MIHMFPFFSEEAMIWRAKTFDDRELETKARELTTPSCTRFQEFQQRYYAYA